MKNLHTKKVPCSFCQRLLRTFGRSDSLRSHLMICQNYMKVLKREFIDEMSEEDIKTVTWKYSLELSKKHRLPRNFEEIHLEQMSKKECVYDAPVITSELLQVITDYKRMQLLDKNNLHPGQGNSSIHTVRNIESTTVNDVPPLEFTSDINLDYAIQKAVDL